MKYLFLALLLIGCGSSPTDNIDTSPEYADDNYTAIVFKGQRDMCERIPDSIFCVTTPSIGDIQPTVRYLEFILDELSYFDEYGVSDYWQYTDSVYDFMVRDCEDVALTLIQHMYLDGYDLKHMNMIYFKTEEAAHMALAIRTPSGMMYVDRSGVKLLPSYSYWSMSMIDAGIDTWVKGNIKL